jgi:hypothetical protein
MFSILGLISKEAFAGGEKPVSLPDPLIEERKKRELEREVELKNAREEALKNGFEPRKITVS